MIKLKHRIIYLFTSHVGRLVVLSFLLLIGGLLGTDGLLQIDKQQEFWNWVMYIGIIGLLIYFVFFMFYAIKNTISDSKEYIKSKKKKKNYKDIDEK